MFAELPATLSDEPDRHCADCGVDTIERGEFYMVVDSVWEHASGGQEMLCIGCLEQRIGRILTADDFTDVPVNDPTRYGGHFSDRLLDRFRLRNEA